MPTPIIHNEKPVAVCPGGGLDFVLLMATPPQEKGKVDEYLSAFDDFYKPSR